MKTSRYARTARLFAFSILAGAILLAAIHGLSSISITPAEAVSVRDSVVRSQLRRANATMDDQLDELLDTGITLDVILDTLGREEQVQDSYRRIATRLNSIPQHQQGAGWGRLVPDPGAPPPHPAIRRHDAFTSDASELLLPMDDIPSPTPEDLQDHEKALEWARTAFFLFPDESTLPAHTAGNAMAEWRNAFARSASIEAWATAAAAHHAADDAAEFRRVITELLSESTSLREDLHLHSHISLQNLLATSASNRILTAIVDAQAASYLAAGPVFVGQSLVRTQFLPSGQSLDQ